MMGLLINMKILGVCFPKMSGKFPNEITKIDIPDGPLGFFEKNLRYLWQEGTLWR